MRVMMPWLALVGLVLGLTNCTHRWWKPNSGWVASKSANVTVYTDALVEHRYSQESLELSHAAYKALLPSGRPSRVDVLYLQAEPGSGKRFLRPNDDPDRTAWSLETVPGEGRIGREGIIVLEQPTPTGSFSPGLVAERINSEARQQMAHQFVARGVPNAPLWLQIGLARYMADHRMFYQGNVWMVCFGERVFPYRPGETAGRRDILIPVHELVGQGWYDYEKRGRHWYTFTAHAFVHYLVHGRNGFHRNRFPIFLEALARGTTADDALMLAYPHILGDEWDTELEEYTHPSDRNAARARVRTLPQGLCLRIPPAHHAQMRPRRTPVPDEQIRLVIDGLQKVDLFRSFASWMPADVVANEAAKRGGRVRTPGQGEGGPEGVGSGKEPGAQGNGKPTPGKPAPDPSVPTIRNEPR